MNRICGRILANNFLRRWIGWWNWVLIGVIAVAAVWSHLLGPLVAAGVLGGMGAITILVWAWRTRPSAYDAACQVDAEAGLKDRISTALYFGKQGNAQGLILSQRRDALHRFPQVDLSRLMAVRIPPAARRTAVLALATGAFLLYRMYYGPPVLALLEATANSHLVQSILAPVGRTNEKELQRDIQQTQGTKTDEESRRSGEAAQYADDPWKATEQDRQNIAAEDEGNFAPQQQDPSFGDAAESPESSASLSQSLSQALKDMLSSGQQQQPPPGDQPQGEQGQQRDAEQQQGNNQERNSQEGQDVQEKSAQNASGAGDQQPGSKERVKNTPLSVKAVPERVALEANKVNDPPKVKATAGAGSAQLEIRNISPKAAAAVNGAEQETIPPRYRAYVQRYFVHEGTAPDPPQDLQPDAKPADTPGAKP